MTKPRSKRKLQPEDVVEPAWAFSESVEIPGRDGPVFRHCTDCGCFKSKHHAGVCRRHPQPLTKEASDGCWDGVPLPATGDEQITEVASMAEVQADLQKRLSQSPTQAEQRAASLRITDTTPPRDSGE